MWRRFIKSGKKKVLVWEIGVENRIVMMRSGYLGGTMKDSHILEDTTSSAKLVGDNKITEKIDLGYKEVDLETDKIIVPVDRSINFDRLSRDTIFWRCRPQPKSGNDDDKDMMSVIEKDDAIFMIKEGGARHTILITNSHEIVIYNDMNKECTQEVPNIAAEIWGLRLPPATILMAELLDLDTDNRAKAVVFCIPYWNGRPIMKEWSVYGWVDHLVETGWNWKCQYLRIADIPCCDFVQAQSMVIRDGKDGLIIYDQNAIFGDAVMKSDGSPGLPRAWEWRPSYVGYFIVFFDPDNKWHNANHKRCGRWGRDHLPEEVSLYQYNQDMKNYTYICDLGTRFNDYDREMILEKAVMNKGFVGVAKVSYVRRSYICWGDKTNDLEGAKFMRWSNREPWEAVDLLL